MPRVTVKKNQCLLYKPKSTSEYIISGKGNKSSPTSYQFAKHKLTQHQPSSHSFLSTTKPIQRPSLPLQSIDNIQACDRLALCMLRIRDCVSDDIFQEGLEHASSFLVDHCRNAFDATTSSKPANCWLRDALNIVAQDFTVTFGPSFAQPFTAFAASRHDLLYFTYYLLPPLNPAPVCNFSFFFS